MLNTLLMTISLPRKKVIGLKQTVNQLLCKDQPTAWDIAHLLGLMIATKPAILPAPLYYRGLEQAKIVAMRGRVNYDTPARMTKAARNDLRWWLDEMECNNGRSLQTRQWDEVIESDASLRGWGVSSKGVTTGGPWTREEAKSHINYLEILAVDALSISWTDQHPYLFPPFALIGKCLQKILQEEVEALLIAPVWQTQIWYPTLLGMLVEKLVLLPNTQNILQGPQGVPLT